MAGMTAEISDWGPFFAVRTGGPPGPPWRPLPELVADPAVLAARIETVRAHLGEVRVAASVAHLGVAARLVAPSLAHAVLDGRFLATGPADLWWRAELSGAFPLAVSGRTEDSPAGLLAFLGRLVDAVAGWSVSRRVLWDNVASAVNGATTMIGVARPDLAGRAVAVADELLALPPLRGTAVRHADGRFRRRSCCLLYRANGTLCGDCVLG
jgi:hypothetical protein